MTTDITWRELCPDGAIRYYEGDDPEGFRAEIKAEFGLDVADEYDEPGVLPIKFGTWREVNGRGEPCEPWQDLRFFCPPEHIDAIYGSERWPLGS
jgi:hypothetical protein